MTRGVLKELMPQIFSNTPLQFLSQYYTILVHTFFKNYFKINDVRTGSPTS